MIVAPDLDAMAIMLRADPNYRVLKRFVPRNAYNAPADAATLAALKVGLYVDCETTGLDTATDRIIELALVPFEFDHEGKVYSVGCGMNFHNDPGIPIPPEVTALTGITNDDVHGKRIDEVCVQQALNNAAIVIAHHAEFDRPMFERELPAFATKPWACSYREVEWERFGCVGAKLQHILADACGEFYDAHRAIDDARVGVHVLAGATREGRTALSYLLDSAREPTFRVWAEGSPYGLKDTLKKRGYRWHDGATGHDKCWYRDGSRDEMDTECAWLAERSVRAYAERFTAMERYSSRARA